MLSFIPFDWLSTSAWEVIGVWIEAIALVAIFFLDWRERRDSRKERTEQRRVREEERQERTELREERQRLEADRQRNDVTCLGVRVHGGYPGPGTTLEQICADLWKHRTHKQPGFAIVTESHDQLPGYLLGKCEPYSGEIAHPRSPINIPFVVFKFPYGDYGAVLEDLRILNLGEKLLAWDENGELLLPDL